MPRRSNLFQDVVSIIHRHAADDATVEESALLTDRVTGNEREVDVVIRAQTAGHDLLVSVEAAAAKRAASVEWVERMLGKHEHLPTDKLVLVSESGFSANARLRAEKAGAVVLEPEDVAAGDPEHRIVNRLRSIWPKAVTFTPERAKIWIKRPEGVRWITAQPDHYLFLSDGTLLGGFSSAAQELLKANFERVAQQIGLADIAESIERYFVMGVGPPWTIGIDGEDHHVYLREEGDPPQLHRIEQFEVTGKAVIEVSEVALTHRRLGEVMYAYGEGMFTGQAALFVATETEEGGQLTIRPKGGAQPAGTR